MIVMEPKEETIEEAKHRLLLAMVDAGKNREFMADVMHMRLEELDEILKAENRKKEKMKYNFGDSLLGEWDKLHEEYVKYRKEHPLRDE